MKTLFILIIVAGLTSHCTNSHSEFISKEYFSNADSIVEKDKIEEYFFKENGNTFIARTDYYSKGNLLSIKGFLQQLNYGCNFFFFSKGGLMNYEYKVGNNEHENYRINYKNKSYIEEGSPLVDFWRKECNGNGENTDCLILHFSNFPRKSLKVQYSLNGGKYQPLPLVKSELLPFVQQGEIRAAKRNGKPIIFIIDADEPIVRLPGLDLSKRFRDTLIVQ